MGVPTSEVGYIPAMPRREDHDVHKGRVVALDQKTIEMYQTRIFVTVHIEYYLAGKPLGMKLLRKYCRRCEEVIKLESHDRGC